MQRAYSFLECNSSSLELEFSFKDNPSANSEVPNDLLIFFYYVLEIWGRSKLVWFLFLNNKKKN